MKSLEKLLIKCGYTKSNDFSYSKKYGKFNICIDLCKKDQNVIYDYYITINLFNHIESQLDIDALQSAYHILDNDIIYFQDVGDVDDY